MALKHTVFATGLLIWTINAFAADADISKADISKLPPKADKKGVTFDADIKPILETSCVKCHGADKPKSKYRLDSRADAIKGGKEYAPAVVPGHSEKSPMVIFAAGLVEEMEMPPLDKRDKYKPLTKDQIGLIRAWIDDGAK